MFGTFQAEEEKPTYGITKPLNSWNAIFANVFWITSMMNAVVGRGVEHIFKPAKFSDGFGVNPKLIKRI